MSCRWWVLLFLFLPFPSLLPASASFLKASTDFGSKGITVNAIAPGGIKTDMYAKVARKYIPNEASMTDEQIDEVWPPPSQCFVTMQASAVLMWSVYISSLRQLGPRSAVLGCRKMFPAWWLSCAVRMGAG